MQEPAAPEAPEPPSLAFTVTETHLIIALESTVERAIRALNSTETKSIDSAKWFTSAKSAIPSAVGLVSMEDGAASGELAWRTLKEDAKNKSKSNDSNVTMGVGVSQSGFPRFLFSQAGSELFDFSLLPEFDAVRKYFGVSVFYGISRPDGFFFEFKHLNLPQSN
jgi:hypothetical protein